MHSAYNRLNAIVTYALTTLVVVSLISHLTSYPLKGEVQVSLTLDNLRYLCAKTVAI